MPKWSSDRTQVELKPVTGGVFTFEFPKVDGAHYITKRVAGRKLPAVIKAVFRVDAQNAVYKATEGTLPPAFRFYFQRQGDDWTGQNKAEFYRWWSNPTHYTLGSNDNKKITLQVPVDPVLWSSVYGKYGTQHVAEFEDCWRNAGNVGITFGGQFFGHGAYVQSGSAQFTLLSFKA